MPAVDIYSSAETPRAKRTPQSDSKRGGQQAKRQGNRQKNDFEHAMHCHADNTKRQQQEPDEWISNERQNRERPAQDEKNAPQQERKHGRDLHAL